MKMKLAERVVGLLKEAPDEKFTTLELAEKFIARYSEDSQKKLEASKILLTQEDILLQISAEISTSSYRLFELCEKIKSTDGRPRRYYYSEKSSDAEVIEVESSGLVQPVGTYEEKRKEIDLYPLLSEYLFYREKVFSMRIDEKRGSNKLSAGSNMWLYPDVVGMKDLGAEWTDEIKKCVGVQHHRRATLWSFEVKVLLNRSNVRESFFQAVSNSSWANYGYLVACEISDSDGTAKELRMLSAAHGIGLIALDPKNPTESTIVIPATERPDVDWNVASRLAQENGGFSDFVRFVRQFHQIGAMQAENWYKPLKEQD